MTNDDAKAMLQLAEEIASGAQIFAIAVFRQIETQRKADGSEVTEADLRIQRWAAERIRDAFPEHAMLGEEDLSQPGEDTHDVIKDMPDPAHARICWVIDPLDGTRNYSRGLPCFTTSIAVLDNGQPVAGLIRDLVTGACYTAIRSQGAHMGERVMKVTDRPFQRNAMVSFQPATDGSTYEKAAAWIRDVHIRNFGTTALHLALIADGCLDGGMCEQNRIWDVAAGAILIEEAGGLITDLAGNPLFPCNVAAQGHNQMSFVAGSPATHPVLLPHAP